ncbi:MAG: glycosyltransferase family 9 protein [Deltaproteobacteria bacterium]|nr:glycosyltransferase family 9 protein [Deltaproteobacteria bacterium]
MKVLIIKLSSLGDVAHTLPAVAALRMGLSKKHATVRVDWLVEEAASGILKGNPLIDNVIVARRGWLKNLKANLDVSRRLKAESYDMVIDFQGLFKSGIWVFMSGAKKKAGFSNARELSAGFLNAKAPAYDPDKHAVERYLDLAKFAGGITAGEAAYTLPIDEAAKISVFEKLKKAGLKGAGFFVIVPAARWATKLWSIERFAELGKRVTDVSGLCAVMAGSASDRAVCDGIKSGIGNMALNMAGMTDLKELAEMMRAACFVVTVDSGPMHVAAAVGADVIALFGPTAPWRTGPYGRGAVVARKGLPCSPCFKKNCADLLCMDGIPVEEVFEAAKMVLERNKSPETKQGGQG